MFLNAVRITLWLVATWSSAPASGSPPSRNVDVLHYSVALKPDIANGRIAGRVVIRFKSVVPTAKEVGFNAGDLLVESVESQGTSLRFEKLGQRLLVHFLNPVKSGETREITVTYQGAPRFGLEFRPEREEAYTIFSSSQWLVCVDAPDERATLDLAVTLSTGLKAVGNGQVLSTTVLDDGHTLHRWRLRTPMPSYTYGFAAGRYTEVSEHVAGVKLRYLSMERSPEELRRIFSDSADMLRFFGRRAGRRYRGQYTQALVAKTIGQELADVALMSEAYGVRVLEDPANVALIAHEAAHQWWGNSVTCRDWGHFWLNEGFANFMAAAYLQRRFGEDAYNKQVEGWRRRLDKLRVDGKDHSLVYASWDAPTADDRAVVYQKGAYALHLLRVHLGEDAFWRGIRVYSQINDGQSVVTADFVSAMETSSGKDLKGFFRDWVY